ncbi:MAG: hypothetical protein J5725_08185 [Bacteroidales bacterium]|nr:hypothetical protein [Bacteroidales bacterium]
MSRKGDFRPKTDLVGKRYTKLVVTEYAGYTVGSTGNIYHLWKCKCDCGNEIVAKGVMLNQKHKMSCGCLSHKPKNPWHTHHLADRPLYNVWKSMKGRCYTPSNSAYYNYGAKGIKVCDEWKNDYMSFHNWAVSQGYTEENRRNCTVDRIDPNGNYCPENCRLATYIEQANNKTDTKRYILYGEMLTRREAAEKYGVEYDRIKARMLLGKTLQEAVEYKWESKYPITINGVTKSLTEWCEENNIKTVTAYARILRYGWNPIDAVTKTPDSRKGWRGNHIAKELKTPAI